MIQAFCRARSAYDTVRIRLRGLEADADYAVTDVDGRIPAVVRRGQDLMRDGLSLSASEPRRAFLLRYRIAGAATAGT